MADEPLNPTPPANAAPSVTPTPPSGEPTPPPRPNDSERLDRIETGFNRMEETLRAFMGSGRGSVAQGGGTGFEGTPPQSHVTPNATGGINVTPEMRAYLRSQGQTDADIDYNAKIIVPYLHMLGVAIGSEFRGQLDGMRNDVEMIRASRNAKLYPDWDAVSDKVAELRETAAKAGQNLPVRQAYEAAVALDPEGVASARAARRSASAANDASVNGSIGARNVGGRARGARGGALTRDEIRSLPPDERKAYFDSIADLPITGTGVGNA